MARFLQKTFANLPFSSPPTAAASQTLSVLIRCLSTSSPVHHRNRLFLPFRPQPFQGFSADLVDSGMYSLSSALGNSERRDVAPGPEESAGDGDGDDRELEFDEIEDMRVRRKLFYKMDRNSKEYEESSFRFHKTKSARNREKVRNNKVKSKGGPVSRAGKNDRIGHSDGKLGVEDGGKKDRTRLGSNCCGEVHRNSRTSKEHVRHKFASGYDRKNVSNDSGDSMGFVDGKSGERREIRRDSGGAVNQTLTKRKKDPKRKLSSGGDANGVSCCLDAKTELLERGLDSESCIVGANTQLIDDEQKEGSAAEVVLWNSKGNPTSSLIPGDSVTRESNSSPFNECGALPRQKWKEGKKARAPTYNQLTDPYHLPFCLDIYITKGSVRACIIHRVSSKVVVVAHSISKDMKFDLASRKDNAACSAVGSVLAQRAIADDIHNVVYTPRKGEKIAGKLHVVLQSIIDNGIDVKLKIKKRKHFEAVQELNAPSS